MSPNNPSILYHLGTVYHSLGNEKDARENIEKALKLSIDFKEIDEAKKLLTKLR